MKNSTNIAKRIAAALMAISFLLCASSCKKETVEEIMAKAQEIIQSANSMRYVMTTDMEMTISDVTTVFAINMTADYVKEPMTMKLDVNTDMGELGSTTYTMYAEQVDGAFVSYMQNEGDTQWYYQELAGIEDLSQYNAQSSMEMYLEASESFVENGVEEINGSNATRYDGVISKDAIGKILGESGALDQLGLDESTVAQLTDIEDVAVSIWVDQKSYIPVKYDIDMTAMMQKLMGNMISSMGLSEGDMTIGKMKMSLVINDINGITSIDIPAEARAADSSI